MPGQRTKKEGATKVIRKANTERKPRRTWHHDFEATLGIFSAQELSTMNITDRRPIYSSSSWVFSLKKYIDDLHNQLKNSGHYKVQLEPSMLLPAPKIAQVKIAKLEKQISLYQRKLAEMREMNEKKEEAVRASKSH
ncbi:hypothetical protein MIND_00491200 [Mycena indigotica]|uniref:Uncharacterized protein n=1 Tax=Mycena indigotica TaxID=2126181 RepID=A0A8H6WC50_9AGAR|nr:uncharacterized protein MIND_00491200 [Mycena indigotica]KAF7306984.1 hypothetical protein MIND_00491200 [Mycena indigotica]